MSLNIETYTRKAFPVKGVQVTEENIEEVAKWCGGEVRTSVTTVLSEDGSPKGKLERPIIKVSVVHPLNDRQTKAFLGDWVLESDYGFKVYSQRAFNNSFEKFGGDVESD